MWTRVSSKVPSPGEVVKTISPGGMEQELMYDSSGLWFHPDGKMYVYYVPEWWKRMGT